MAIQEDITLYEILFRFDANGLVGAHQKHMVKVWDPETGQVWVEREADPQPLKPEDFEAVLSPAMAKVVTQVNDLKLVIERGEHADVAVQERAFR